MTARKWIVRGILVVAGLFIVYLLYICYLVWHYARTDQARPVDAIVVLGSAQYNGVPSADLKARLDHALKLWNDHYADTIVVTGGKEQGDLHTEASTGAAYLGAHGVPDDHILREVQGRNSWQSLQAASRFMKARGIHRVLLVSDSFHNARIYDMAEDLGLKPYVSATKTSPIHGAARIPYLMKETAEVAVGKIIGWERIGGLERNL